MRHEERALPERVEHESGKHIRCSLQQGVFYFSGGNQPEFGLIATDANPLQIEKITNEFAPFPAAVVSCDSSIGVLLKHAVNGTGLEQAAFQDAIEQSGGQPVLHE